MSAVRSICLLACMTILLLGANTTYLLLLDIFERLGSRRHLLSGIAKARSMSIGAVLSGFCSLGKHHAPSLFGRHYEKCARLLGYQIVRRRRWLSLKGSPPGSFGRWGYRGRPSYYTLGLYAFEDARTPRGWAVFNAVSGTPANDGTNACVRKMRRVQGRLKTHSGL